MVFNDWSFRMSGKKTVILEASKSELVRPLISEGLSWMPSISTRQLLISLKKLGFRAVLLSSPGLP